MKCVSLKGNIAQYACRTPSLYVYLPPGASVEVPLEVGDLVRVSILREVYDGQDVWDEEEQWWRGRVRFLFRSALGELPRSLLLPDVPGYRSRAELRQTLSRMVGREVDVWDTIEVVCIDREDYDLNELRTRYGCAVVNNRRGGV